MRLFVFVTVVFCAVSVFPRSKRVDQIPNGSVFQCRTCHTGTGGPRNPFGQLIEAEYLDVNGDVIWENDLAILDADEDGGTNGQELLDPDGSWEKGDGDPGSPDLVTNPGDPESVSGIRFAENKPETYGISNYPNPFNSGTQIQIFISKNGPVRIDIFDIKGQHIRTLVDSELPFRDVDI
ncbi:MAG: T9SS type A sorting domain-containing protein [candidate division KSB1 bacterium]|nr:T9SS type A sorting domain-containing protein [candidate division KSB1 bacterium]